MIEFAIRTNIFHPIIQVDACTLAQMQTDAEAKAVGRYLVLWYTGEERILIISWSNAVMLEQLVLAENSTDAEVRILLPPEPSGAIRWTEVGARSAPGK